MRKLFLLSILVLNLCACASQTESTQHYVPAIDVTNVKPKTKTVARRHLVTTPNQFLAKVKKLKKLQGKRLTGLAAIRHANKKALKQPNSEEYFNAIMTYDFVPGALYKIYCAPLNVTDVELRPGERIISVAAGDTLRWQVSKTFSGVGSARTEHLVIKPLESRLRDSLVVTTDQRTYHFMMYSTNDTYMASVRWRYPESDNLVQNFNDAESPQAILGGAVNVNQLDFHYDAKVENGETPGWMPTMIFNDGNKTYIRLGAHRQEAPALFVGADGDRVINYRVEGNYYVIDRVVESIELRSGQEYPTIVKITYEK